MFIRKNLVVISFLLPISLTAYSETDKKLEHCPTMNELKDEMPPVFWDVGQSAPVKLDKSAEVEVEKRKLKIKYNKNWRVGKGQEGLSGVMIIRPAKRDTESAGFETEASGGQETWGTYMSFSLRSPKFNDSDFDYYFKSAKQLDKNDFIFSPGGKKSSISYFEYIFRDWKKYPSVVTIDVTQYKTVCRYLFTMHVKRDKGEFRFSSTVSLVFNSKKKKASQLKKLKEALEIFRSIEIL